MMSHPGGSSGASGGERDRAERLAKKWETEAVSLDRLAETAGYTTVERMVLRRHARIKRSCAQELRLEFMKVTCDR